MFQPFQTLLVQLHNPPFCISHSQNFTLFTILFYAFPLFRFEIYNYNCTIPILQLQTTFYNCANSFIHSFILAISIAPLQVLYRSEALPTTARILYRSCTPTRTGNSRYRTCPRSLPVLDGRRGSLTHDPPVVSNHLNQCANNVPLFAWCNVSDP